MHWAKSPPRKCLTSLSLVSVRYHGHVSSRLQSWPKLCGASLQNALPRPSISFSHGNKRSLGQILPSPPRVVQYWRLVSTRKANLSIRTSRTGRLMYSRVVVDPCISLETLRIFFGTENLRGPRYGLSTRTSRTGRLMYSRVVVDSCISLERLRIFFGTENLRGPRYGLTTRTSRTGRVMNSRVVVDRDLAMYRKCHVW